MDKLILGTVYLTKSILYGFLIYIGYLAAVRIIKGKGHMPGKVPGLAGYSFTVYILVIAQATGIGNIMAWHLTVSKAINWVPFVKEEPGLILLNVLLFIPMGVFVPILFKANWNTMKILILGLSSSLVIEMIQLLLAGRTADVDDVLANTGGCIAGYLLFRIAEKWLRDAYRGKALGPGSVTGVASLIVLLFCVPIRRIFLGDILLMQCWLPAWSGDTRRIYSMEGIHYTLVIGVFLELLLLFMARKYRADFGAETGLKLSIFAGILICIIMVSEVL